MSDSLESLSRKMGGARDLASVVRTMKALAASSVGQYETAIRSLAVYYRTVELGLVACIGHDRQTIIAEAGRKGVETIGAVVFGSDQGLAGQFNDIVADFAVRTLSALPGEKKLWAVGDRVHARLADSGLPMGGLFSVPNSVGAITPLVGQLQVEVEHWRANHPSAQVYLFHNKPGAGASYQPASQRLIPLDAQWQSELTKLRWPTGNVPQVLGGKASTLRALVREYLFISLFRTCAESLASENTSRLLAMQRAEKNIDELMAALTQKYNRQRQTSIDEELFDVISGFEALTGPSHG
jgi:F-type H+-transporting ATPase subunit gamma